MKCLRLTLIIFGSAFLGIVLAVFVTLKFHHARSQAEVSPAVEALLEREGTSALESSDVPVAAGLWYGDSLLGIATNTVRAQSNAGGHAEINAISEAIRRIGLEAFSTLSRDSLVLVTTFEPCGMCREAIAEYDIRRVVFVKEKSLRYRIVRELWREWSYYFRRRSADSGIQDRLFERAGR